MAYPSTLSSAQTFLMKFVFPVVGFLGLSAIAAIVFFSVGTPHSDADSSDAGFLFFFVIVFALNAYSAWRFCIPLKQVRMDDKNLYISNYFKEIVMPLSNVARVSENGWINIHPVTIHFLSDTEFGPRIVFMPTGRWFVMPWSSHPAVEQIRRAVANATGSAPAGPVE